MEIKFTESYTAAADGSVTCEIDVGGNKVACRFTAGALEDVNPDTADLDADGRFQMNMERLHALAHEKLMKSKVTSGSIEITASDV